MHSSGASSLNSTFNLLPTSQNPNLTNLLNGYLDYQNTDGVFPQNPLAHIIAANPLPSSCVFCNAEAVHNLFQSTIQIPVPVQVNLATGIPSTNRYDIPGVKKLRMLGENELMQTEPNVTPHQYLIPMRNTSKQRPEATHKFANRGGLDKWYLKRRTDQLQTTSLAKNKLNRVHKTLKRLQNNYTRIDKKNERKLKYNETRSIRESKLELLQRKGMKAPTKVECPLWNCPRKEYRRNHPYMANSGAARRSASRLSNLSTKSRSPIVFQRAPLMS